MTTLIGQELGGYRIISQIGQGGMATVYKAFQPSLDRYVAVKVMPPFYTQGDETFVKRFKREAQSIAKLRHPNILIVIDYGEQNGLIYIVMEFVDAGTLTDRLGKPMPYDQAYEIIEQVASALDYAHSQGLVHRDVKPSNILLPKPDWPLLTDFGLAKIVGGSHLTITGSIAGTPAYMSPEQGQGESVDARSDIYSLGIVLYEMMTGRVPYEAETPMAVIVKHIIEPLPLPTSKNPDLPEAIERVILKALAKNPDDRYQRANALAEAFKDALITSVYLPMGIQTGMKSTLDDVEKSSYSEASIIKKVEMGEELITGTLPAVEDAFGVKVVESPPELIPEGRETYQDVISSPPGIVQHPREKTWREFLDQKSWLKWLIPAGAAAGALCLIGFLFAVWMIPVLKDDQEKQTQISPTLSAEEQLLEGQSLAQAGDYSAAIQAYQAAIDQGINDYSVNFSLAEALIEVGKIEDAIGVVEGIVRSAPRDALVGESAGLFYQRIGDHYNAITHLEKALELNPDAVHLVEPLAESYRAIGEYSKAEEIQGRLQGLGNEQDPNLLEGKGWEFLANEDLAAAEEAFRKAVDLDPTLVGAWEGLANVYEVQDKYALAIETLNTALVSNPNYARFYEKIGWYALELEGFDQADKAFNKAVFLDSSLEYAWLGLAEVFWYQDDLDGAIEVIERAIKSNPDKESLYEKAGFLYWEKGDFDIAIGKLEKAIEIAPGTSYAYITLAEVWIEMGNYDQALTTLESALRANPNRPEIYEAMGSFFMYMEKYQDAITSFNQAISLDPEDGWFYLDLAYAYQTADQRDEAIKALQNADKYSSEDPWLLASIGEQYLSLGDCSHALIFFNRALEIDPTIESAKEGVTTCSK